MRLANPKELSRAEQARLRRINQSSRRAESASQKIASQVGTRHHAPRPKASLSSLLKSGFGLFKNKYEDNQAVERITNFYPARDPRKPSIQDGTADRDIHTLIRKARFYLNKPGGLFHRKPVRPMPVNMRPVTDAEKSAEEVAQKPRTNVYRPQHRPFIGQPGQPVDQPATAARGPMRMAVPAQNLVVPRMVARANASTLPLQDRPKGHVRRMLYYSLGSTGVEIKLPALPIIRPGWRLLSGIMAVMLTAAIALLIFAPVFKISSVEVTGLQRLDPAKITPILEMNGKPIITLHPGAVAYQIQQKFPELQAVNVYANLPSSISIAMVERQPVMVWQYSNVTLWVDAEGYLIPVYGETGPLLTVQSNVPPAMLTTAAPKVEKASVSMGQQIMHPEEKEEPAAQAAADGPAELEKIDPELLRAAFQLNAMLPPNTTLIFNNRRGLGWVDNQGINVYVGLKYVDMPIKITEYQVIAKQLALQGVKPGMISVENLDVPFYRMEK